MTDKWKKDRRDKEEKEKVIFKYYDENVIRYFPYISHSKKHGAMGWHIKTGKKSWDFVEYDCEQSVEEFEIMIIMRIL